MEARGGILEVQAAAPPLGSRSKLQWRIVQGVAKVTRGVIEDVEEERRPVAVAWSRHRLMTSLLAATLGAFAAGLSESGGAGVALPCASARRCRPLPDVFADCLVLVASLLLMSGQSSGS